MHPTLSPEGWKTARAAIRDGWGPTLRFLIVTTAPTVLMIVMLVVLL